jgi:hypothetical protein
MKKAFLCMLISAVMALAAGAYLHSADAPWYAHPVDAIASDVAAQDGNFIWAAGPYGRLSRVDYGQLTPVIPVNIKAIAVDYEQNAWYVNEQGEIVSFGFPDFREKKHPGSAIDIAAGPKNIVWVVSAANELVKWNGTSWSKAAGIKAKRVSVAPDGKAWYVGMSGETGIADIDGLKRKLPGTALDIAVGQKGDAWIVGTDGALAYWSGSVWIAAGVTIKATAIAVAADGVAFAVKQDGKIARIDHNAVGAEKPAVSVSSGRGIFHKDGEVKLLYRAKKKNAITFVAMGDGYIKEDLEVDGEYDKEVKKLVDFFMKDLPPFSTFKDYINVYVVYVRSNERGADSMPDTNDRDTVLNCTFFTGGVDQRMLTVGNREVMRKYAKKAVPKWDLVLVSVNDTKYGGTGSAEVAVGSRDPESHTLMAHELGHSIGRLADEYVFTSGDDATPLSNVALYPNIDTTNDLTKIKWKYLIGKPGFERVGAFEGAFMKNKGVWRPQEQCIMRHHNMTKRYCAPCEEAVYKRLCEKLGIRYSLANFVKGYTP